MSAPGRAGSGDSAAAPGSSQNVSLWFLANVIVRRYRLVAGVAFVIAFVVALFSFLSTRMYVASASFIPQEPRTSQSLLSQLAPSIGVALGRANASSPEFYANLLGSKELSRDVLTTTYHLAGPPVFDGDLIRYFKIETPDRHRAILLGVRAVQGVLSVHTDRATGIVSFDVETDAPELSELVAKRFLELVNDYNLRRQQSQAHAESEFFSQRLEEARRDLGASEDLLAAFLSRNRTYENSPELRAQAGRLERQVALRQQLFLSLSQTYELAKVEEVRNTPAITVIQHPDGFVEAKSRGTVKKGLLALLLGLLAGGFIAFGLEHVGRLQGDRALEYEEFRNGVRSSLAGLRGVINRKA